jgi:hypothetical protein
MADEDIAPAPVDAPLDDNTQRRVDYAKWLTSNQHLQGTPEFVKVADAYRTISDAAEKPQGNSEAFNVATRFATKAGISPIAAADLGVAMTNANLNPLNWPADLVRTGLEKAGVIVPTEFKPIPEPGAAIRTALNVPHEAATPLQRGAEFGAEALSGGAPAIVRSVVRAAPGVLPKVGAAVGSTIRNVVAPVAGAQVGGEIGGQMFGETGRLAGSLLGGAGAQGAAGVPQSVVRRTMEHYDPRQYASDTAPQTAQYAQNQNVRQTFGSMANRQGVALEKQLMPASPRIEEQSNTMLTDMQQRGRDLIDARRALPARTPENVQIVDMAERTRTAGGDASQAVQQSLQARIGNQAPVAVSDVIDSLNALKRKMDPADFNTTVAPRLGALLQMLPKRPDGSPIPFASYEQFKNWRSNLGRQIGDMPGMQSHYVGEVYDPATKAMRDTAIASGVKGGEFDAAMDITRSQQAAADLQELMRKTLHSNKAPNARQFANKIEDLAANDPTELGRLGGSNVDDIKQLGVLARQYDYPSAKGGGAKVIQAVPTRFTPGVIAGAIAHTLVPGGGSLLPLAVGAGINKYMPNIEGRILESPWARNRIAQGVQYGPQPQRGPNSFDKVLAAMSAANLGSQ